MMKIREHALTFDDVLLLPRYSNVLPKDVDLSTRLSPNITLNIPLLSAAMDTVTEARLAVAMAEEGGLGIIHKNMSIERQAAEVRRVKKYESGVVMDPITVTPSTTIRELINISKTHNISGMPVVERLTTPATQTQNDPSALLSGVDRPLVGIVTHRDIRFETQLDRPVSEVMTPKERLITIPEGADAEQAMAVFRRYRVEKLLIVNDRFELRGMYTIKDILKSREKPNACRTSSGQLRVGAAVSILPKAKARVEALVAAGVDMVVVDTAHGHSSAVLECVTWVKQTFPDLSVMAGNVATADGAMALAEAGADAVKVGMGPGSICTTRVVAGIGVPQVSAIANAAQALAKKNVAVVADGGIRFSGDICKAIAAGASAVMLGGLFAGTEEAPGEVVLFQGRSYKSYRGMGSVAAMASAHGSSDRYFQEAQHEAGKYVPEGIEGRVPYKGLLQAVVYQLMGGLRSSMGYTGCASIQAMRQEAEFVQITAAGVKESHVHDVIITKEAPNYWVD